MVGAICNRCKSAVLLLLVVALLLMNACTGKPLDDAAEKVELPHDSQAQQESQTPTPQIIIPEREITVAVDRSQIGQLRGINTNTWVWSMVGEGLLTMDPDEPENIKGALAYSWEHSDDYLMWTFNICEGVMFSDGTQCDAYAIKEYFDLAYDLRGFLRSFTLNKWVASWEALSKYEFCIHLSEPCAWMETDLCTDLGRVASPTALKLYGFEDIRAVVGTGPYVLKEFVEYDKELQMSSFVLGANENYRNGKNGPEFSKIEIHHYLDNTAAIKALEEGKLDAAYIKNEYAEQITGTVNVFYQDSAAMWLNPTVNEVFMDKTVRKAFSRFLDLEDINERLYSGFGRVQSSIWAQGTPSYVEFDDCYFDAEEALSLLAEAGYEPADLSFEFLSVNLKAAKHIENQLSKYGIVIRSAELGSGIGQYANANLFNFCTVFGYRFSFISALTLEDIYSTGPQMPWMMIMKPDARGKESSDFVQNLVDIGTKFSWQEIYDPELYGRMCEIYDSMISAHSWDEMVQCSRELTRIMQEDYAALPFVQEPFCFAIREGAEEDFDIFSKTSAFKFIYQG